MPRPTDNVSLAGNLTSEPLDWAGDLVDLRKTDNTFEPEQVRWAISDLTPGPRRTQIYLGIWLEDTPERVVQLRIS